MNYFANNVKDVEERVVMARHKKEQKTIVKSPPSGNGWLKGKRLYALVIFAFSFALYFNTVFNDYNLDDELVTNNHRITSKGWDAIKFNFEAFNSAGLQDSSFAQKFKYFLPEVFRVPYYQDKAGFKYEYRPVVFASFALEHALFAKKTIVNGNGAETDSAAISHFINIMLYALLCVLLFFILCNLFRDYNIIFPFIISLLFAAYPMHTEDVASIKNRDELLALIFGLLSLYFSLAYIEKNKVWYIILVLLFFISGILSKPTTIIFALLIPLCLVMFTKCNYLKLMFVAIILIIPAAFYSRLYTAIQQVELGVLLLSLVTFLYSLKSRASFTGVIKGFFIKLHPYFKNTATHQASAEINMNAIKKPLPVLLFIFGALVPAAISAYGIFLQDPWVTCVPLILCCILFISANNELKLLFITPLSLVMLFAFVRYWHYSSLIETGVIIFLAVQIFSGSRLFRLVGLFNYILFSILSVIYLHSFHFLLIILFVGLVSRKLFIPSLILLAVSAFIFIKKISGPFHSGRELLGTVVLLPVFYSFVFLLWRGKWKPALNIAVVLLPLSLLVYFIWAYPAGNHHTLLAAKGVYHQINSIKAADPTPVQSVRPLNFPEYPISNKDPLSVRLGTAMEVSGKYLRMVIIPYPMSYYYGYSIITPQKISDVIPLLSLLIHLLLLTAAIYFFRKMPVLSFSILFYLISIVVFSTFITPVPGMVGDRFLLIPSIGFCTLTVYMCFKIFKQDFEDVHSGMSTLKQPLKITLGLILVLYSGLTFSRNMQWKDHLTLFRHDIKVVENSAQAQNLLGVYLLLSGNHETNTILQKQLLEEAIPHFKKALEIYPGFLNPSYDLGRAYEALQLNDEAFAQYQTTVKIDTTFAAPYFNMATIMHNKGLYEACIPLYEKFLAQYPKQLDAYTNLSFAYFQLKDFDKSIATNRLAIIKTGNAFYPTENIAKTYAVMGQTDSALFYFEKAHALQPDDGGVNLNISRLKGQMIKR